ncbi:DUF2971 domain-containing protein [Methylomonas paludis]|uniref:DUF2971 domain-containing protein n=1 Tax=Methylomonas paludis TaxID=1173101 RepID=A0A975MQ14_9GAMM|nr:DUF2971 domain-containing protein [Methylomonas paludis]QWF71862.1 DUF2971 domain-containing protein [Methylomonas paludis]
MKLFHFTKKEFALLAIRDQRLKVAQIDKLNDPFEFRPYLHPDENEIDMFNRFKQWVSERTGILCFSRKSDNPVQWAHYGDSHQGVALEFCVNDDNVCEVKYSCEPVRIDLKKGRQDGGFLDKDYGDILLELATTKWEQWQYENEVRVFCPFNECQKVDDLWYESFGANMTLVGIVIGYNCHLTDEVIKSNLPPNYQISVTRVELDFSSFKVVETQKYTIKDPGQAAKPSQNAQAT